MRNIPDADVWLLRSLIYFSANVSYSSLPVFLPTVRPTSFLQVLGWSVLMPQLPLQILEEMGFSSIRAQGLSAPPYLASFIAIVSVCFITDRIGDRTIFIIPLALLGGAGYLILALATLTGVRCVVFQRKVLAGAADSAP